MQAEEISKNQHYVPRFLLRNFSVPLKSTQICVFDKQSEKSFVTNIKNVCSETGFYNLEFEDEGLTLEPSLSQMESLSAGAIQRIIDAERLPPIDSKDRAILAIFVAAQFLRVKTARIRIGKMNELMKIKLKTLGTDENDISRLTELGEAEAKIVSMKLLERLDEFLPFFFFKTWTLMKAPNETPFLISDSPVTLQNRRPASLFGNLGLGVEGIEIYMPLSTHLSLGFLCPSHEDYFTKINQQYSTLKHIRPEVSGIIGAARESFLENVVAGMRDGTAIQLVADNVLNLNSLQTAFSHRFVYGNSDSFDVVREMIRDNPKFKTANYPEFEV